MWSTAYAWLCVNYEVKDNFHGLSLINIYSFPLFLRHSFDALSPPDWASSIIEPANVRRPFLCDVIDRRKTIRSSEHRHFFPLSYSTPSSVISRSFTFCEISWSTSILQCNVNGWPFQKCIGNRSVKSSWSRQAFTANQINFHFSQWKSSEWILHGNENRAENIENRRRSNGSDVSIGNVPRGSKICDDAVDTYFCFRWHCSVENASFVFTSHTPHMTIHMPFLRKSEAGHREILICTSNQHPLHI